MAAKHPDPVYSCDICGEEGLTDGDMRSHMLVVHIEGAISCPFCDLGDISADEMLEHVNTVHLDYELGSSNLLNKSKSCSNHSDSLLDNNNLAAPNANSNSPQRSHLSLNLNPPPVRRYDNPTPTPSPRSTFSDKITSCPLCGFEEPSPSKLQEHINRQHFDLTSPSFPDMIPPENGAGITFSCPLCSRNFETSPDLELHVNMDHHDILSPARSTQVTPGDENSNECCPVCGRLNFSSGLELASHIEEHFDRKSLGPITNSARTPSHLLPYTSPPPSASIRSGTADDASPDHLVALAMEQRELEEQRIREQREFRLLQAQYGMDNQGNFREQSITNMQRAVYAGEMSVADYYNRQVELKIAEMSGVDDGHSCTKGLIPKIRAFSAATANVQHTWLCTTADHYGSTYGDRGWGCGYRNIQMMLSALIHNTSYNQRLFNGKNAMPSISKLQELIERAWRQGFDLPGCEQLGGRLTNTRKWIGATEIVTFLSYFRIRCHFIDCHRPTGIDGTHPEMFRWVKEYFSKDEDFRAPIYLQHHGHSRTIIGLEELKDGSLQLLVFDPSHSKAQMEQFSNTAMSANAMRLIRRPLSALKARQYQLVAVAGIMDTDAEYYASKILKSERIPTDV